MSIQQLLFNFNDFLFHVGTCPSGQMTCVLDDACVSVTKMCDGIADCKAGEDELFCAPAGKYERDPY